MSNSRLLRAALSVSLVAMGVTAGFPAQPPAVRAILFYSPTCPHCHTVIREDIPGIFERFGGTARVWFDGRDAPEERVFFLVSNGQLEILLVNVALTAGAELYQASTEAFQIPRERGGVPRLIIADSVLVGSYEIPTFLPELVEAGRAAGGVEWPAIAGLEQALATIPQPPLAAAPRQEVDTTAVSAPPGDLGAEAESQPAAADTASATSAEPAPAEVPARSAEPTSADESPPVSGSAARDTASNGEHDGAMATGGPADGVVSPDTAAAPGATTDSATDVDAAELAVIAAESPSMMQQYARDPVGNSFSVVVLAVMVFSLGAVWWFARVPGGSDRPGWLVPIVAVIGAGVAIYLTYVESSGARAVCGPVGDCNTVQSSEYATLFGAVPVGVLGLAGYAAILAFWVVSRMRSGAADWAALGLLGMAIVGTVFSIYLTFLEPFVIGATCLWCLSSVLAMTLLLWFAARPGVAAWRRVRSR